MNHDDEALTEEKDVTILQYYNGKDDGMNMKVRVTHGHKVKCELDFQGERRIAMGVRSNVKMVRQRVGIDTNCWQFHILSFIPKTNRKIKKLKKNTVKIHLLIFVDIFSLDSTQ